MFRCRQSLLTFAQSLGEFATPEPLLQSLLQIQLQAGVATPSVVIWQRALHI